MMNWWAPLVIGFIIALVTGGILGWRKAITLPGGSLVMGALLWKDAGWALACVGGALGLAGWGIYVGIVRWREVHI